MPTKVHTAPCLAAAIVITAAIAFVTGADPQRAGLAIGTPPITRITYQFLHANLPHLAVNLYALTAIITKWRPTALQLAAAFTIAAAVPPFLLSDKPIVGLSALFFALCGLMAPSCQRPRRFTAACLAVILAGALLANVAAAVHLYAFLTALAIAIIHKHTLT